MTHNLSLWERDLELAQQIPHCVILGPGKGVGRTTLVIQPALVADAYRMLVVALHMRPHKLDGAGVGDGTVTADVVVVTDAAEATAQGLGSCILGWIDDKKLREITGLDAPARLVITLGYAAEGETLRVKTRKSLEKLVSTKE